jgi:hypothetical protein
MIPEGRKEARREGRTPEHPEYTKGKLPALKTNRNFNLQAQRFFRRFAGSGPARMGHITRQSRGGTKNRPVGSGYIADRSNQHQHFVRGFVSQAFAWTVIQQILHRLHFFFVQQCKIALLRKVSKSGIEDGDVPRILWIRSFPICENSCRFVRKQVQFGCWWIDGCGEFI